MLTHTSGPTSIARRVVRAAFAVVSAVLGLMLLFRTGLIAASLPFLVLSVQLAFPPTPLGAPSSVRDLLDSTTEVRPLYVVLGLALFALIALALSFSGPFWSWLTDRIPYAPPRPYLLPLSWRVSIACGWLVAFLCGAYHSFRGSHPPDATVP